MCSLKSLVVLSLTAGLSQALPMARSELATEALSVVEGVGNFQKHVTYTFTGSALPEGLHASDAQLIRDQTNGVPYNHIFQASNVGVRNGFLEIRVPGGQNPASATDEAISSGEVFTDASNILYASVRTKAIFSAVEGTCQSSFFYRTDNQETDIEFLSDPASVANAGDGASIHYTNQAVNGGDSTTSHGAALYGLGKTVHEYRHDWTPSYVAFYIDGALQQKYTDNVPSVAGTWLWNNWANGDTQWTVGPPAEDSVMKIQSIEMYYNTTSATTGR